jgi:hypothetical protein
MIHTWLREYECKIVSRETALFNTDALKYWSELPPRDEMRVYCGIDPASSEAKDAHKAAIVFWGVHGPAAYLLDYYLARGKNPEELWGEYLSRALVWRPLLTAVEAISYQRVLAWYFESVSLVNVVYGSIGAVVVVLLLMEIGALVILLGAQVIAEYERFVYREKFLAPRAGSPRNSRLESGVIGTVGDIRNGLSEMRPRDGTGQLPGDRG